MKRINKYFFIAAAPILFSACAKDLSNKVTFDGGTAPVLTASTADSISLPVTDTTSNAVTFSWTNPNYMFSNGISSQNVTYYLEFDTVASFNSSVMQIVSISSALSETFTVSVLNSLLANQMGLATGIQHTIMVRIESFIQPYSSGSAPAGALTSSALSFTVTPYSPPPIVAPPSSGQLWLVGGDALLGAWANPVPADQEFTQVTPTKYTLTIALSGGDPTNGTDQYLFLPVNGSWTNKYACAGTSANTSTGGPFGYNLSTNFPGVVNAGTYTITVNFQSGTYSIVPN